MGLFYLNGQDPNQELLVADLGTPASQSFQFPKTATTDFPAYILETGKTLTWSNTGGTVTIEVTTGNTGVVLSAAQARYNAAGVLQETGTFGATQSGAAGTKALVVPDVTWTSPATDDRIGVILRGFVTGHQNITITWDVGNTADVLSVGTEEDLGPISGTAAGVATTEALLYDTLRGTAAGIATTLANLLAKVNDQIDTMFWDGGAWKNKIGDYPAFLTETLPISWLPIINSTSVNELNDSFGFELIASPTNPEWPIRFSRFRILLRANTANVDAGFTGEVWTLDGSQNLDTKIATSVNEVSVVAVAANDYFLCDFDFEEEVNLSPSGNYAVIARATTDTVLNVTDTVAGGIHRFDAASDGATFYHGATTYVNGRVWNPDDTPNTANDTVQSTLIAFSGHRALGRLRPIGEIVGTSAGAATTLGTLRSVIIGTAVGIATQLGTITDASAGGTSPIDGTANGYSYTEAIQGTTGVDTPFELLGANLLFDFNPALDNFKTQYLAGNNTSNIVDSSRQRTLGSELLTGPWTFINFETSSSVGPTNFSGENTTIANRARATSNVFSMTLGKCYEVRLVMDLKSFTDDWDMFLVSGPTSNAADSGKIRFEVVGRNEIVGYFVCTETSATGYLIINQSSGGVGLVNFEVSRCTLKEWTSGYYAAGEDTVANPSGGGSGELKTNGIDEFMDMNHHLAAFAALTQGSLLVQYNSAGTDIEFFLGIGDLTTNDDSVIIKQDTDATLGIYKTVAAADQKTTYTNTVEGGNNNLIVIQTDGVANRYCELNNVVKSVGVSSNYDFFDLVSGTADAVYLLGKEPNLAGTYHQGVMQRMIFVDRALTTSEINILKNLLGAADGQGTSNGVATTSGTLRSTLSGTAAGVATTSGTLSANGSLTGEVVYPFKNNTWPTTGSSANLLKYENAATSIVFVENYAGIPGALETVYFRRYGPDTGSPVYTGFEAFILEITDAGGDPSTGATEIAVSEIVTQATWGATAGWHEFTFATPIVLDPTKKYGIGIRHNNSTVADASNYANVAVTLTTGLNQETLQSWVDGNGDATWGELYSAQHEKAIFAHFTEYATLRTPIKSTSRTPWNTSGMTGQFIGAVAGKENHVVWAIDRTNIKGIVKSLGVKFDAGTVGTPTGATWKVTLWEIENPTTGSDDLIAAVSQADETPSVTATFGEFTFNWAAGIQLDPAKAYAFVLQYDNNTNVDASNYGSAAERSSGGNGGFINQKRQTNGWDFPIGTQVDLVDLDHRYLPWIKPTIFKAYGTLRATLSGTAAGVATQTGTITDASGGAGPIDGTASGVATTLATIRSTLSGTSVGIATTLATLRTPLIGTSAGVGSQSGTLSAIGNLSGTAAGVATTLATLRSTLSGTAAGVATQSGTLKPLGIAGTASGVATQSGTITGIGTLQGTAAGIASQLGTLSATGDLAGTAAGVASQLGTIYDADAINLIGTINGTSSASGTLQAKGDLAGTSNGVASQVGYLIGYFPIDGSADGTSSQLGTITGRGLIDGSADGSSSQIGTLSAKGTLAGSADGSATQSGTLSATGNLAGTAAGQATLLGDVFDTSLDSARGTAAGTSSVTGTLSATGTLQGTAAGAATLNGVISGGIGIAGTASGAATTSGTIHGVGTLQGTSNGASTTTGTLAAKGTLEGTIVATSSATGTLQADGDLEGTAFGQATVFGRTLQPGSGTREFVTLQSAITIEIDAQSEIATEIYLHSKLDFI